MKKQIFKYISFVSIFLLLNACGFGSHSSRGKLSEVMDKASDDNDGDRVVTVHDHDDDWDDDDDDEDQAIGYGYYSESDSAGSEKKSDVVSYFGFSGGSGIIAGDFSSIENISIHYGIGEDRLFAVFYGGYYRAPIKHDTRTGRSVDSPLNMLKGGLEVNYFTTPKWTFLGNRLIAGLNFGISWWNYRNPVNIAGSSETISGDQLSQFELYVGTGVNVIQTKHFNIGFYIHPGVLFFGDETGEGFENDFFDPVGYLRMGFNIDLKSK